MRDFLDYLPKRLRDYDHLVMGSRILKARTVRRRRDRRDDAIEWGVTGPNLRACGFEWDFRKKRPYSGYDRFHFDIPTAQRGDCYGRAQVRVEEIRQSLRIVEQCLENMPSGPYKADTSSRRRPQGAHASRHRDADRPFPHGELGPGGPGGRGVRGHRGDQGEQRLLPDQRRRDQLLQNADPHPVVRASAGGSADVPRLGGGRI